MLLSYNRNNPLLVNSEQLLGAYEAADYLGIDLSESLAKFNINASLLVAPTGFLAFHQVADFLEDVATRFDCPQFGFLAGKYQPPLRFGPMSQVLKLCPDVETAINQALKYSMLNSEVSNWQLENEGGYTFLRRQSRVSYSGPLIQAHTMAVTVVFKALKAIIGEGRKITSVSFRHAAPGVSKQYSHFFGCAVDFEQEFDGFVFPEQLLSLPLPDANSELLEIVKSYLDSLNTSVDVEGSLVDRIRRYVKKSLGSNGCNLESAAQHLGLKPRSLQRELVKQGTSFRQILLNIRQEVAEHYLRNSSIALADLAGILGYRNVSAFSRAFKGNCGQSPEYWRREI